MSTNNTYPTLSDHVIAWQAGRAELAAVVSRISDMVYRYPLGKAGYTEDDCADFLLDFYPRITRLVRKYRPAGQTFESYLRVTMKFQFRTFAAARGTEKIRLALATAPAVGDEVFESSPTFAAELPTPDATAGHSLLAGSPEERKDRPASVELDPPAVGGVQLTRGEAQRLLFLALKSCDRLDSDGCRRVAFVVGCDPVWLEDKWLALRTAYDRNRARLHAASRYRDRCWFEARLAEARLERAVDEEERAQRRRDRDRWQARLETARMRIRRIPTAPTHGDIARVLEVAKGTVDSSIFKGRREIAKADFQTRLATLIEDT